MEYTDLTRIHWVTRDKDGTIIPLEHTTFKGKGMERLAEFDALLQRLKDGERGYIRFYRDNYNPYDPLEVCNMNADNLQYYGGRLNIKNIKNWVVLLNPIGVLELYSKRTGRHLFTLGDDPRPEWVEGRYRF